MASTGEQDEPSSGAQDPQEVPAPPPPPPGDPGRKLLELASRLWERGLCEACLGRQTARLAYGLTNTQRGRALLISLSMAQEYREHPPDWLARLELPYRHLPQEAESPAGDGGSDWEVRRMERAHQCRLCEGLFEQLEELAELALEAIQPYEAESFKIGTVVEARLVAAQAALVKELGLNTTEPLKQHLNRELSRRLGRLSGLDPDPDRPHLTLLVDTRYDTVKVQATSLFIKSRYRKLVRNLPQTHWPCRECRGLGCHRCQGTGYRYPTSVEQLVAAPLVEASQASGERFHGAGREDIDVRCLGRGRPFVLELRRPRLRRLDLEELAQTINETAAGAVEVGPLEWTTRPEVARLKQAQYDKRYRAKVAFQDPVSEESLKKALSLLASQVIQQQTPTRVAHRRALKVRERHLRGSKVISCQPRECELELTCEHGTYVKELVHGDEGRTTPNLAALLDTPCQVTALDVLAVHDIPNPPE